MTTKHTPGPWTAERADGGHPDFSYRPYLVRGTTGYCAQIHFGGSWPDNATANANARLISAAPELLEALKFLLADYRAIDGASLTGSMVPSIKAMAAIAKAEGK